MLTQVHGANIVVNIRASSGRYQIWHTIIIRSTILGSAIRGMAPSSITGVLTLVPRAAGYPDSVYEDHRSLEPKEA